MNSYFLPLDFNFLKLNKNSQLRNVLLYVSALGNINYFSNNDDDFQGPPLVNYDSFFNNVLEKLEIN